MANIKYKLVIEADTNDADYVTEITDIDKEDLDSFRPIIEAIKNCKNEYNWECDHSDSPTLEELYPDFIDTDAFNYFQDCVPSWENGVHSINSITVYHVVKEEELL